ncbi:MAG: hypothetical protein NTV34_03145, partial [Proteobacteria bacterium]|nr:hypothetical protein [Pseudomonadota bacterium]
MILRLMMTFALLTGYSSAGFADPLDTEEPQPGSEEPELPSEPPESGGIRVTPEQCQHAAIQAPLVRAAYDAKILHLNRLWYALGEMHKKYREAGCETNWFLTKNCRVG